ncbi:MAG: hypothetical protein ACRC6T_03565 [Sarcina sp.]
MKIAIIIGILWILGILFYLSLFKAAARGDRMLEKDFKEKEKEDE